MSAEILNFKLKMLSMLFWCSLLLRLILLMI